MPSLEFRAMGSRVKVVLEDDRIEAANAIAQMPAWFSERERRLSRFMETSALARLDAQGSGRWIDRELWDAIDVAIHAAESTEGLVTPTVLRALVACGYARSFDANDRRPRERRPSMPAPDFRAIEREPATRSVRLPNGVGLDLGGTAKGWAADRAACMLGAFGPALVDAGGDIAVSNTSGGAHSWPVAIADPIRRDGVLELLALATGGVATSGRDHRTWQCGDEILHHVIDPRTGAPAKTDVLTATVIGPSALDAEVAAKVVLILGAFAGLDWIDSRPQLAALVVREGGAVLRSRRFGRHVWERGGPDGRTTHL